MQTFYRLQYTKICGSMGCVHSAHVSPNFPTTWSMDGECWILRAVATIEECKETISNLRVGWYFIQKWGNKRNIMDCEVGYIKHSSSSHCHITRNISITIYQLIDNFDRYVEFNIDATFLYKTRMSQSKYVMISCLFLHGSRFTKVHWRLKNFLAKTTMYCTFWPQILNIYLMNDKIIWSTIFFKKFLLVDRKIRPVKDRQSYLSWK